MDLKTAVEARHHQFSSFQSSLRRLCIELEVRCESQKKELITYNWSLDISMLFRAVKLKITA